MAANKVSAKKVVANKVAANKVSELHWWQTVRNCRHRLCVVLDNYVSASWRYVIPNIDKRACDVCVILAYFRLISYKAIGTI